MPHECRKIDGADNLDYILVDDNPNFNLYDPRFEYDQNITEQMRNSMYGENRKYFNLHTLHDTKAA